MLLLGVFHLGSEDTPENPFGHVDLVAEIYHALPGRFANTMLNKHIRDGT